MTRPIESYTREKFSGEELAAARALALAAIRNAGRKEKPRPATTGEIGLLLGADDDSLDKALRTRPIVVHTMPISPTRLSAADINVIARACTRFTDDFAIPTWMIRLATSDDLWGVVGGDPAPQSPPLTRAAVLQEALRLVTMDREDEHGDPADVFGTCAKLWGAYLGDVFSPSDVCMMLALLKVARQTSAHDNTENYTDMAGYAALAAEMALKEAGE